MVLLCVLFLCRTGLTAAQIRSRVSDAFRVSVDGGDLSSPGSSGGPSVSFGGALGALGSGLTPPPLVSEPPTIIPPTITTPPPHRTTLPVSQAQWDWNNMTL